MPAGCFCYNEWLEIKTKATPFILFSCDEDDDQSPKLLGLSLLLNTLTAFTDRALQHRGVAKPHSVHAGGSNARAEAQPELKRSNQPEICRDEMSLRIFESNTARLENTRSKESVL